MMISPHYVLRRGNRYLANVRTGRTVPEQYPHALNTCDRAYADRLTAELNELDPSSSPWVVEQLEGTGDCLPVEKAA